MENNTTEESITYWVNNYREAIHEVERLTRELKFLNEYVDKLNVPADKTYTIYVDIRDGVLQSIYGNQLPIGCQIDFIERNWDIIATGNKDPYQKSRESDVRYW